MNRKKLLLLTAVIVLLTGCAPDKSTGVKEDKIILTVLAGQSTSDAGIEDMVNE